MVAKGKNTQKTVKKAPAKTLKEKRKVKIAVSTFLQNSTIY